MRAYVVKRLLLAIPTLWGITLVTFLLMKSIPGDPVIGMVGERADPEVIAQMRENLGLDRPLAVQYVRYMRLLCKGELGRSHYTHRPVAESIAIPSGASPKLYTSTSPESGSVATIINEKAVPAYTFVSFIAAITGASLIRTTAIVTVTGADSSVPSKTL